MSTPVISVIVPCYNCIKTIEKCVSSLLKSEDVALQIILADDGSTDGTGDVCSQFATSFSNVTYLSLPHGGVSAARNAGLRIAIGDYIGFTDADDYVEPNMFSVLLKGVSPEGTLISVCGYILEYSDCKTNYCYKESYSVYYRDFLANIFLDPNTEGFLFNKLFSAELLKGHFFDEALSICEDLCFISGINAKENSKVAYCPGALYHYVQNDQSLTGGRSFFINNTFRYSPAFYKLRDSVKDKSLKSCVGKKYYKIIRDSMKAVLTVNDKHPSITKNDKIELRSLKKELQKSNKAGFFSDFSFKEKLAYTKNAFLPMCFLKKSLK